MTHHCLHLLFAARHDPPEPAEYCASDALPGSDFCTDHQELGDESTDAIEAAMIQRLMDFVDGEGSVPIGILERELQARTGGGS